MKSVLFGGRSLSLSRSLYIYIYIYYIQKYKHTHTHFHAHTFLLYIYIYTYIHVSAGQTPVSRIGTLPRMGRPPSFMRVFMLAAKQAHLLPSASFVGGIKLAVMWHANSERTN